jgi:hypothetical protein
VDPTDEDAFDVSRSAGARYDDRGRHWEAGKRVFGMRDDSILAHEDYVHGRGQARESRPAQRRGDDDAAGLRNGNVAHTYAYFRIPHWRRRVAIVGEEWEGVFVGMVTGVSLEQEGEHLLRHHLPAKSDEAFLELQPQVGYRPRVALEDRRR